MSVFEIIMLVCFGAAWPFSIRKSLKSRSTRGKSLIFLLIILAGYVSGIIHKIVFCLDPVIVFYCINLVMVSIDIVIFIRNKYLCVEKGKDAIGENPDSCE
jgi:hypothetical protein